MHDDGSPESPPLDPVRAVIAEAVLVGTAFRLRDDEALLLTLRRLVTAIDRLAGDDQAGEVGDAAG